MDVICNRCGYRFKTKEETRKCPYCGEKNTISELKSAETLIDEIL